jgi:hypothetical protein
MAQSHDARLAELVAELGGDEGRFGRGAAVPARTRRPPY